MNREEFQNKVRTVMKETWTSVAEAVKIIEEQYKNEGKKRREREEKRNEAAKTLLSNSESKTILVRVHEFIPKEQAIAIAHGTIKVGSFHFINQLVQGKKDTWLVASEFTISQADALNILLNLNSGKYSHEEVKVIVENFTPFDLR
ncbi:hypothetical protein G6549_19350 [Bacillus sp. MM2020_1]|nr:hypothetical protein [Bacillus sp. MM2020_1]